MSDKRLELAQSIKDLKGLRRDVTCIVPFYGTTEEDLGRLRLTLASLKEQEYKIKHIIIIDDGTPIHPNHYEDALWYGCEQFQIIHNKERYGKARSMNEALRFVTTDLLLIVDSDTAIYPDCLKELERHLVGGIVVTSATVVPRGLKTWIERARYEIYQMWDAAYPNMINGCAFLTYTNLLLNLPFDESSFVEDTFLALLIAEESDAMSLVTKPAVARTEEPKTVTHLVRQLTRWKYGDFQLKGNVAHKIMFLLIFPVALAYLVWLPLLWVMGGFLVLLVLLSGANWTRLGDEKLALFLYGLCNSLSYWVALGYFTLGRKPKW